MITTISDIKRIRKQIGLTQKELATIANVSQSLIAKIESNHIDPSYSNIQKLDAVFQTLQQKKEKTAKDIMQKKVFYAHNTDSVHTIIKTLKKHEFSQIPVKDMNTNTIIGLATEKSLMNAVLDQASTSNNYLEEVPPLVQPNTPVPLIIEILKYHPLVLVNQKGSIVGIITRSDVLNNM